MAVQITVYRENHDSLFAFQVFSYNTVMHLTTINEFCHIQICSNIEYIITITLINVV